MKFKLSSDNTEHDIVSIQPIGTTHFVYDSEGTPTKKVVCSDNTYYLTEGEIIQ